MRFTLFAVVVPAIVAMTVVPGCGDDECHAGGDAAADAPAVEAGDDGEGEGGGAVLINTTITNCAIVSPIGAAPENGGTIEVSADVAQAPNNGAAPMLQWTATAGGFANPQSARTTFTCPGPGPVTVTLTASSPGCSQSATMTLTCS